MILLWEESTYMPNNKFSFKIKLFSNLKGKFVIGHVGRFFPQKNHEFLIDIFNEVYKKDKNTILMLVGGGELQEKIEAKVRALGLEEAVRFVGIRSDVNYVMQGFDLFLLPSLYEGLPVTMIEAQAAGLNCIISDRVPKQCAITNNVEIISLSESVEQWAEKILNYKDGCKKTSMYDEIVSKNFDIKKNAKWMESFYLSALGKNSELL